MASPSPTVTDLISELKTCFSSIDFQNVAKLLTNREQDLLNKTHFLENEKDEILKQNKKLNALLTKNDVKIESLVKENDEVNALLNEKDIKIQNLEKENDGLKNEVKKKQTEIGVFKKRDLDLVVRVLNLEKASKELMGFESFSGVEKAKKVVSHERSRPPPPPPLGFKEIRDPIPKKEKESKLPVIIEIDDDDDDDDDHGDRDLMKVSSSKRRRVSDEIKRDDDDDDKCISVLKRRKVSEEVIKDHKKANYVDKIPRRTQPTTHSKSPFCDSSGSDSDNENAKISATMDLPKDRWETEWDMVIEFAKDYQLCWNAICALHKQEASQKHVFLRSPVDASRISSLARKKLISDLSPSDLHQSRQYAMEYSALIFDIYKVKSDTFFPAL